MTWQPVSGDEIIASSEAQTITALEQQLAAERQRADERNAAAGQMRAACRAALDDPPPAVLRPNVVGQLAAALSSTAGQGWVGPDVVKNLKAERDELCSAIADIAWRIGPACKAEWVKEQLEYLLSSAGRWKYVESVAELQADLAACQAEAAKYKRWLDGEGITSSATNAAEISGLFARIHVERDALRERVKRLEDVLRPFYDHANCVPGYIPNHQCINFGYSVAFTPTVGQCRAARDELVKGAKP